MPEGERADLTTPRRMGNFASGNGADLSFSLRAHYKFG
jgi:hypothetical protein